MAEVVGIRQYGVNRLTSSLYAVRRLVPGLMGLVALTFCSYCFADFPLTCMYAPNDGLVEIESHSQCAAPQGSQLLFSKKHLIRMHYSRKGLAEVLVNDQWYYVKTSGESLPVVAYDNGPDYFSEGVVRSLIDGKIAYHDATFRQVIPPRYDWGFPFDHGRAIVCKGCLRGQRDANGHTPIVEGVWGRIDIKGNEVTPVTYSRANLPEA